jgi:pyrroline-5-carboxylate reductase
MKKIKVGVIGCGNMGKVIIDSLVDIIGYKNVFCCDIDDQKVQEIKQKYKINSLLSNKELAKVVDIIILAVKPQQIKDVLEEIKDFVDSKKVVVSIAAGIKIKFLESVLGEKQIIRVMPNLPMKIGMGVASICKNKFCHKDNFIFVKKIFSKKSVVIKLDEKFFDLITAVSGSGPAYIFYISEIMQEVATKLGLPKEIVSNVVNYTILGAAKMLTEEKMSAKELREAVTSKKGTTEQAIKTFEIYNTKKLFYDAIKNAFRRAKEISKEVSKI